MSSSAAPIIIAIILVLVALGPVLTLFPSPRERLQSRLRQLASREGYRVEFVPSSWARTYRYEALEQSGWILYWLPWPANLSREKQRQLSPVLYFRDQEVKVAHPLIEVLPIPDPFSALFVDNARVGLLWRERGATEALESALRSFRGAVEAWCEC